MLHKVVLTFESVDETRKCDHSNESKPLLSGGTAYYEFGQCGIEHHLPPVQQALPMPLRPHSLILQRWSTTIVLSLPHQTHPKRHAKKYPFHIFAT